MIEYMIMDHLPQKIAEDFVEMGMLAFGESAFSGKIEFDDQKLLEIAEKYAVEDGHVLLIAVDGGETVGVFAGNMSEFYFSSDKFARDVLWYVREEYRKLGVGLELLAMFEAWAKGEGAKMVYLSQDSGINMDKFTRMLDKRGYGLVGANYSLGVS